jgi:hypothetical protein
VYYSFCKKQNNLTVSSLLISIEEIISLLLTSPVKVKRKKDNGRQESSDNKSTVIDTKGLDKIHHKN